VQLDAIAEYLIEMETIDRKDFEGLFESPVPIKRSGTPIPLSVESAAEATG
jgi:hypothetical protein